MNWIVLITVGIILVALVLFTVFRNQKDEKELEQQLNNDFHKSKDQEGDEDPEEPAK